MRSFLLACCLAAPAMANSLTPFALNLSQVGGSSAVYGSVLAQGLNFEYGLAAAPDGSVYFRQTTTTYTYGLSYGLGLLSTGSAWKLPRRQDGSFGQPQIMNDGLGGVVTGIRALSDGTLVVDSGSGAAGGSGNRQMSFVSTAGKTVGLLNFSYPAGNFANCEHCNGFSLVTKNEDGGDRVYFIVGSKADNAHTSQNVTVSGLGLTNISLNSDSVYMMNVSSGGSGLTASTPVQVASGLRNPFGLSLDSAGNLLVGNNGIDGSYIGDELGADTLSVIPSSMVGMAVSDFGFPDSYVRFSDGVWVNGNANAVQPLVAFRPVANANGVSQKSEGLSGMAYAAAGSLPFVGALGGEIVGFFGRDTAGAANDRNALLYYDFASGLLVPILDAGTAGVGHLNSILVSGHTLFLGEMASSPLGTNLIGGLGSGAIYSFDFSDAYATPEPGTLWLALAGIVFGWKLGTASAIRNARKPDGCKASPNQGAGVSGQR